jgi:hypothetical protein
MFFRNNSCHNCESIQVEITSPKKEILLKQRLQQTSSGGNIDIESGFFEGLIIALPVSALLWAIIGSSIALLFN